MAKPAHSEAAATTAAARERRVRMRGGLTTRSYSFVLDCRGRADHLRWAGPWIADHESARFNDPRVTRMLAVTPRWAQALCVYGLDNGASRPCRGVTRAAPDGALSPGTWWGRTPRWG